MNIRQVADQLQNGLSLADQMLVKMTTKFTPLLVHNSISSMELVKLRKARVSFRGVSRLIEHKKNGFDIAAIDWPQ